ncbi:MAG: uroporphyrinogen-III C-methyltransferase [Hylemonella sp.]|uniref:uroporphyrinogen-III C-methyltransferase n=1 Tax=Hylemonella sp. TaxID=2066020 RepID=UPI0022CA9321|nr:uroporphyrinogen-III C-methyltransferase [Hylemonella sp.]MCZ8251073.1 uroporphyrinogen-III C-methyltransferase [Hylemonella sp.]
MTTPEPLEAPETPGAAAPAAAAPTASAGAQPSAAHVSRNLVLALGVLAILALLLNGLLWERLSTLQDQLTRQTTEAAATAAEARTLVRQTQEQERNLAARQAVLEARLGEVALQRSQLEELMQSLSRTRDENLVVDIESAIRLAQQQAQLTGSMEPLLAALRTAEQRVQRAPQARLAPVQRALARDMARIKSTPIADTPTLLARLDELVRLADELPLANAVGVAPAPVAPPVSRSENPLQAWWQRTLQHVLDELRGLVRVSRIDTPEAVLLTPEQSFFVRENYKLLLLNARLGLLARQPEATRADLLKAANTLGKYFDASARRTRVAAELLQQTRSQMQSVELPRADETLAALAAVAPGR